jgi:hypothetical protein
MTYWAIGRLAVIALTGTFVFAAVPAFAACSGDKCADSSSVASTKHSRKIHVAHRRHRDDDDEVASNDRRSSDRDAAKDQAKVEAKPNTLPADVADARAQMMSDDAKAKAVNDTPTQAAGEAAAPATPDSAVQVVNADELNDLDKAASEVTEPLPKLPASIANSRAEMRFDGPSSWAQTSTIGKAFIAFGVMLTLASAARMFMA